VRWSRSHGRAPPRELERLANRRATSVTRLPCARDRPAVPWPTRPGGRPARADRARDGARRRGCQRTSLGDLVLRCLERRGREAWAFRRSTTPRVAPDGRVIATRDAPLAGHPRDRHEAEPSLAARIGVGSKPRPGSQTSTWMWPSTRWIRRRTSPPSVAGAWRTALATSSETTSVRFAPDAVADAVDGRHDRARRTGRAAVALLEAPFDRARCRVQPSQATSSRPRPRQTSGAA